MVLKTLKPRLKAIDTRTVKMLQYPQQQPRQDTLSGAGRDGVNGRIRGRKGMEIRARHLSANPLCVVCFAKGVITVGQEVDHVQPLWAEGNDDDSNRQTLCIPCHKDKTFNELSLRFRVKLV